MALPYDLRELIWNGKPLWKRIIECIFSLSDQIDALDGGSSSGGASVASQITALEARIDALEALNNEGGE